MNQLCCHLHLFWPMTSSGSLASPPSASTQVLKATSALTSLESLGLSFTRSEGKSSREQVHCWSFSCALTTFPVNRPNNLKIPLFLQYLKKKIKKILSPNSQECPRLQNSPLTSYKVWEWHCWLLDTFSLDTNTFGSIQALQG